MKLIASIASLILLSLPIRAQPGDQSLNIAGSAGGTPAITLDAARVQSVDATLVLGRAPGQPPHVTAADCSGEQTLHSRGFEAPFGNAVIGLVRQLMGCPSAWTFAPPAGTDRFMSVGSTPNHRLLWRVWYYGWAMRAGTEAQKIEARASLSEFFASQFKTEGQYWGETLTTSHYQIWMNGVAGARFIARHYGDQEMLDLTGQWFRRELYLYDLLARDGHVFSPGSRSSVNNVELRDVVHALLRGVPAPERLKPRKRPGQGPSDPDGFFWSDPYNFGAWTLREMIRSGDDVGGAAGPNHVTEPALLRDHLCIYSKGSDFLFVFPRLTKASDALFWTARVKGKLVDAPYRSGEINSVANPYPTPILPGASLTVVPGVNGSASECAPM